MTYVGKIHIKIDGVDYLAKITDEGVAVLPSGEEKKLTDEQFAIVKEKLEEAKQALAKTEPLTMPPKEEKTNEVEPASEPQKSEPPAEPVAAPVSEEQPAQTEPEKESKSAEQKIPVSEIKSKHEVEMYKKQKNKGKTSTVLAIIFAILFVAETAALGVGYAMGYVGVSLPSISTSSSGGYIETENGEVTSIQPAQG